MQFESFQILAGFASTAIFAISKAPMLAKALRTRDLHSYSIGHMGLSAGGNLLYWFYVVSLPVGPIWLLQGFFTLADLLMLSFYVLYELRGASRSARRRSLEGSTRRAHSLDRWLRDRGSAVIDVRRREQQGTAESPVAAGYRMLSRK